MENEIFESLKHLQGQIFFNAKVEQSMQILRGKTIEIVNPNTDEFF